MALQLILGSSGSGKSYQLYRNIIEESMKNPSVNYIILVPEQFSMEAQKDIVRLHPQKGIMNIDIVSFGRLAHRIFEEVGARELPILDDTGKNLILRKILEDEKKNLILYGSKRNTPGFVGEVKSVLSEFYQYGIHAEELEGMLALAKKRPMLEAKLRDMKTIYNSFESYLKERYITKEEILETLCREIKKSRMIPNSVLCLDGFTGFTPIQYKLLGELMCLSRQVLITVTLDNREDTGKEGGEQELFHLSRETIRHIERIAEEKGVEKQPDFRIAEEKPYRFRNQPELLSLENNLFRYPYRTYSEKPENICIYAAENPLKEAEYVARQIQKLVRKENYRYQEIAVITGDMERYADVMRDTLKKHHIPCFLDQKKSIMGNPFVEFIRGSLGIIAQDYSYESVFRYLRSGMTDIKREDIDYLENYCIALGIRGRRRWNSQWVRNLRGRGALDLDYVNRLRTQVTDLIEPLWESWGGMESTVYARMEALHIFITEHRIQDKLSVCAAEFEKAGRLAFAKEYQQIYRLIMELFDKMVDLLGKEHISRKELCEIMDAGFEEIKVGLIPPSMDQILVGDIERTRLKDIKALFFVGVNDTVIPKSGEKGGLLSQMERTFLMQNQITLAPTQKQRAYTQRFYLYMNLTKPSERLYISYSNATGEGKAARPSYLVSVLKKLFPALCVEEEEDQTKWEEYLTTPEGSFSRWIDGISKFGKEKEDEVWQELFSWYLSQEEWNERARRMMDAAFYRNTESGIGRLAAASLYGPQPLNSVTRLEQYAACAFAHFLTYGLRLRPRQEFEVAAADMGTMFHNAMERYSKKIREAALTFSQVDEETQRKLVKESVQEITIDYGNQVLKESARNAYLIERLERITARTVWALTRQLQKGSFEPVDYEVAFSEKDGLEALTLSLSGTDIMRFQGRIDRMDRYEDEEHVYVKILDYKSGSTGFDLPSVYYGLQLQLVVYLDAAMEMEKRSHPGKIIIPAGIFYYNIKDPLIEKQENMETADIEKGLLEELRMNGLVNQDRFVVELLDGSIDKKSEVIPIAYNKDGDLSKSSCAASGEQFARLMSYVKEQMRNMGTEIVQGDTAILPYEKGKKSACDYCVYRSVCGFDEKIPGYQKKHLRELDAEEIWKLIST